MTYTTLYTDYPWADCEVERSILAAADCELIVAPDSREATQVELARDCDVILTCWAPVSAPVIDAAERCRGIVRTGIGLDNIDVAYATSRGVPVTNVPDYCIEEVAEHALAMIFDLGRRLSVCHHATKRGEYDAVAAQPLYRLSSQTLGVIGLGRCGAALAAKARALGMRVLGTNRSGTAPDGVEWVPLDRLLAESDYVSLNCPLNDETRHLAGAEMFAAMKPTAYLVNTSRGGLVDEAALAAALDAGRLAGAALDVQAAEPPDLSDPLFRDPRVIVTPHTAFISPQSLLELRERVARQAAAFLAGREPENVVNRDALR